MATIGAVNLQITVGNLATVGGKTRRGRCVHKQREMRKGKSLKLRGRMNVRTMTMKDKELVDRSKGEGLALILMDMLVRETEVMRM